MRPKIAQSGLPYGSNIGTRCEPNIKFATWQYKGTMWTFYMGLMGPTFVFYLTFRHYMDPIWATHLTALETYGLYSMYLHHLTSVPSSDKSALYGPVI